MATASPPVDWQVGKTLSESFDHLLTSGIASDVTFIVGEEKNRVSAHKLVLLSRSPVFYAMLEGPMAEKGEITIPDITLEAFNLFLRYLYTDKINLTGRNVLPVFDAARKYCVDILSSLCETFFSRNLTVGSVCVLMEQAHVFMMESLKEKCLQFILESASDVLQSETFNELCLDCVAIITESDNLHTVPEKNVYEALTNWAEAECGRQNLEATAQNKRNLLGDILYNVRYLHAEDDFLFGKICSDKILKSDDIVDLINQRRNQIPLLSDKLKSRKRFAHCCQRIYRNGQVRQRVWLTEPENDGISFQPSADVYLVGFGSFHTAKEPSGVSLKVYEENFCLLDTFKTLAESQPDTPHMGDVRFDKPIKLRAGKTYTLVELANREKVYYFENGLKSVALKDMTIVFSETKRSRCTNTNRGQIPYLILQ
ncbi:BTB/POZ domain-containing protein 6-like [Pecten maximus]|uniref:BTB/POZ domain-containing protein 6-like n=1 Tax=Pecten maximus TaxID=6579 RepID=UPI001457FDC9|nr:BTB/POZ domain-containing protein 6-like [Pecten maximus]XP_033726036.1 BTB/POZ domain-containing protein 6-like [Pecten maximus]